MKDKIKQIGESFKNKIGEIRDARALEDLRLDFLGKKGQIAALMENFKTVAAEEKKELGMLINSLKVKVTEGIAERKKVLEDKAIEQEMENAKPIDFTLSVDTCTGSLHPRTLVLKEVEDVFVSMGFVIEDGFEIETEYNNFDAVNVPATHPARDMQDTFWLDNGQVLKAHTRAAQNR